MVGIFLEMCPAQLGHNFHHLFFPAGVNKDASDIRDLPTYVAKFLTNLTEYHEKSLELRSLDEFMQSSKLNKVKPGHTNDFQKSKFQARGEQFRQVQQLLAFESEEDSLNSQQEDYDDNEGENTSYYMEEEESECLGSDNDQLMAISSQVLCNGKTRIL